MLKTERANLSDHQQEGSFDKIGPLIHATIRDAIGLVPLIGERFYGWTRFA